MALNHVAGVVISADSNGVIDYWDQTTTAFPADCLTFRYKTDTDLYDLAKVFLIVQGLIVSVPQSHLLSGCTYVCTVFPVGSLYSLPHNCIAQGRCLCRPWQRSHDSTLRFLIGKVEAEVR